MAWILCGTLKFLDPGDYAVGDSGFFVCKLFLFIACSFTFLQTIGWEEGWRYPRVRQLF